MFTYDNLGGVHSLLEAHYSSRHKVNLLHGLWAIAGYPTETKQQNDFSELFQEKTNSNYPMNNCQDSYHI
jgi:hypothetical protein